MYSLRCCTASEHYQCNGLTAWQALLASEVSLTVVQGLHASVNVLDVELVSIDREQQSVVLSDNRTLQYGVLVLSMGLSCEAMVLNQSALGLPQVVSLPMLPGRIQKASSTARGHKGHALGVCMA